MADNYTVIPARLRISRSSSLALTTSWQVVDFSGTSPYNVNTFAYDSSIGKNLVYWDSTSKLIKFSSSYDMNLITSLFATTSTNLLTTKATVQVRFVIPNGVSPGVDLYFPYPDETTPYADLGEVTLLANGIKHQPLILPIYANSSMRTNGFRVEIRLSNSLITLGTCSLNSCTLSIQQ